MGKVTELRSLVSEASTKISDIMKEPHWKLQTTDAEREFARAREAELGAKMSGKMKIAQQYKARVQQLAKEISKERMEMEKKAKASRDNAREGVTEFDVSDAEKVIAWAGDLRGDSKFYSSTLTRIAKLALQGKLKSLSISPEEENKDWIKYSVKYNGEEDDLMKKKVRKKEQQYYFTLPVKK